MCVVMWPMVRHNSYPHRVVIGPVIAVLNFKLGRERKSTATMVATVKLHAILVNINLKSKGEIKGELIRGQIFVQVQFGVIHNKHNTNVRKTKACFDCSMTVRYFNAFVLVRTLHCLDFRRWFQFWLDLINCLFEKFWFFNIAILLFGNGCFFSKMHSNVIRNICNPLHH